ncbi:hypothetical protein GCM10023075_63940 [Streptosporangium album]
MQDVGDGGDGLFEGVDGVAVCGAHGDEDEGLEGEAEGVGVEGGTVAAFTLFPENTSVLTVEYKINLLAPAVGDHIASPGRGRRPSRGAGAGAVGDVREFGAPQDKT